MIVECCHQPYPTLRFIVIRGISYECRLQSRLYTASEVGRERLSLTESNLKHRTFDANCHIR